MSELPIWSFVIRRPDGTAVLTAGGNMMWHGRGEHKEAARADALQRASRRALLPTHALRCDGSGFPENEAAEMADRR